MLLNEITTGTEYVADEQILSLTINGKIFLIFFILKEDVQLIMYSLFTCMSGKKMS